MSDCKCLVVKYVFVIYKKPKTWFQKTSWSSVGCPEAYYRITIHGDSLQEIQTKRDEIKKELLEKYDSDYAVKAYSE